MPTYDYRCRKCGHVFELFHGMRDEGVKRCPRCRGRAQRVPASGVGLLFKGSGFYITDYAKKGASDEGTKSDKSERSEQSEKGDKADKGDKASRSHQKGSWSVQGDAWPQMGRLGYTSLSVLTLEVYYRHLPLYRKELGSIKDEPVP